MNIDSTYASKPSSYADLDIAKLSKTKDSNAKRSALAKKVVKATMLLIAGGGAAAIAVSLNGFKSSTITQSVEDQLEGGRAFRKLEEYFFCHYSQTEEGNLVESEAPGEINYKELGESIFGGCVLPTWYFRGL